LTDFSVDKYIRIAAEVTLMRQKSRMVRSTMKMRKIVKQGIHPWRSRIMFSMIRKGKLPDQGIFSEIVKGRKKTIASISLRSADEPE
jgi:hypothetical protein